MTLGFLLTVSCVMTTISMIVLVGVILFFARFGGQGVKMLIDRFLGGNDEPQVNKAPAYAGQAQSGVASSRALRQRARELDFPAPTRERAPAQFGAQSAQSYPQNNFPPPQSQPRQQASLSSRGQYPEFNPQASQPSNANQGFQPSTPSLSPSRPFQAGRPVNPQQGNTSNQGNQFGRQQAQQPNQGMQPLQPNQQGFNAQGAQPQQAQNPPQGGLGQNRPPLRSLPRPGNTQYDRPIGGRDRRQGDDRDYIYDDRRDGGNFVDDVGDFIDNF